MAKEKTYVGVWKFKHGILAKNITTGKIRLYYVYARNQLDALCKFIEYHGNLYFIYKIKGYELTENQE